MYERVNPCHPDKVADRIAGALVDAAYRKEENPRIAVEVLLGHGVCHIIAETSVSIPQDEVASIVHRIAGKLHTDYVEVPQDGHLANNQADGIRCGDNGIFKGMPVTEEQKALCEIAKSVYHTYPETSCQGLFNQIHKKATKKCQKHFHAPDTQASRITCGRLAVRRKCTHIPAVGRYRVSSAS